MKLQYHPIVYTILVGTAFSRIASSMSIPFLAIHLLQRTDLDPATAGFIVGLGPLAGTVAGMVGGGLSDRFGRRVVMLASMYVWAVVCFGFGLTSNVLAFGALSVLNGCCKSFFEPTGQALMADLTPKEKRFRVFSLRYWAANIGVSVGPLLGTAFALSGSNASWYVTGGFFLLYAVVLQVLLARFGIRSIEGARSEPVTMKQAASVVLKDRVLALFVAGAVFVAIGYAQMTVSLSQYVESIHKDGVTWFAWLLSINAVTVILLQMPLTRFLEKRRPIVGIVVGSVFYAAGNIGFAWSETLPAFIVSMIVFTIGEISNYPAGSALIDSIAPEMLRGTYFGANQFGQLGQFIGPWGGGLLLAAYGGPVMFTVMAGITLLSIVLYGGGIRLHQRRSEGADVAVEGSRSAGL
ncbi:MDR family MFS transporter [Paenibacillus thermotolerans]|uniref:MDR family MFS transporter n=1 Tax=Paenibacillus thermotolerans TaxID=3027807 RepID=UPI0023686381|nr:MULTISPECIES: MFS transporter [unclassified Paenibacillus]